MSFVHLHNHTHYTFQKALGTPAGLAKRAKELGQTAIAITDTGNMYGAFEFYKACVSEGIKPIVGVECTLSRKGRASRDKDNDLYEIVLLAENYEGYKNLIQLVTISQTEGYYNGRVRIDFEVLEKWSTHLIALSGSMYGEIGQAVITGRDDDYIRDRIEYYRGVFGQDRYFLEIEEHMDKPMQPRINETIVRLSRQYGYPIVGTNNAAYLTADDAEVQDIMACVSDGRALEDPDRPTLMGGDYSIRPSREMEEILVYAPGAYENTQKIADMIDLHIEYGDYKIPKFPLSDEEKQEYEEYQLSIDSPHPLPSSPHPSPLPKGEGTKQCSNHISTRFGLPSPSGRGAGGEGLTGDQAGGGLSPDGSLLSTVSQQLLIDPEQWLLRRMCIEGLNYRYQTGLSREEQQIMIEKLQVPPIEKKISAMSLEELHEYAEASYSPAKWEVIRGLDPKQQEIISRLEYELVVVDLMGFNAYFCIVADFIRYGKANGVPVGPGRGSAAGAILAYLSGITDIDPLRYGLLFERFLNPARVSMPDIDVDFSDDGRDRVLQYVRRKYGADHVAQVCTFGTLAARAALKDSGKALGLPFAEMNEFAKQIPSKPGTTLTQALEESPEFRQSYDENEIYHKVIDSALRLEGAVRQLGVHACAVIIAPEPMTNFCPLQPPPKDPTQIVTQYSAYPLEALGLLKMDFLGLKNLTILDRAVKIVKEVHGVEIDLLQIDYEDQKVLELFGAGDMMGVFQFESSGMRKYLRELKPSSFEDLIAMVSLYRPGPLAYIPEFIDRKFGRKTVEYPHPSLESILKPTYGIAVYQEQIMQLVQAFAGFSLGEADILRRAIGKKKYDLLMEQRAKFIEAAAKEGHKEELAIYIFDQIIEPFAGYGFNKSHAACYSMIAYQTGYMKAYYPTEFITALMTSDEEDTDRLRLEIEDAKEKGVQVLPPDVDESRKHFTFIDATTIRFGLLAIKGLGEGPVNTIRRAVQEKKFESIYDFIDRTGADVINKKALEALIFAGALDQFGERKSLIESIPRMTAYLKENAAKKESAQIGLFDGMDGGDDADGKHFDLVVCEPMTFEERMKGEKMMIGYPVSGHPLDGTEAFVRAKSKNVKVIYDWIESRKHETEEVTQEEIGSEILIHGGQPEATTLDSSHPVLTRSPHPNPLLEGEGIRSEERIPSKPPFPPGQGGYPKPDSEASISVLDSGSPLPLGEGQGVRAGVESQQRQEIGVEKKDPPVFATLIGFVSEVKRIPTKSGKMMLIATAQSVGFDFTVIVFGSDYETYQAKILPDTILIIDGRLKFDTERGEVSISPSIGFGKKTTGDIAVKTFGITRFREMAGVGEQVTGEQGQMIEKNVEKQELQEKQEEKREKKRENKIDNSTHSEYSAENISRYTLPIPTDWTKSDLLDLRSWLESHGGGSISVWISVGGVEKDTKFSIDSIEELKEWISTR